MRLESFSLFAAGGVNAFPFTLPGTAKDKVTFLGAADYAFVAGAVGNISFSPAPFDVSTTRVNRDFLWLTGMIALSIPVEGGRTAYFSATASLIVTCVFSIEEDSAG